MRIPRIAYPGAKGRLAPKLIQMMPETGGIYYEPFVGRGNVVFAAATMGLSFKKWHINDISTAKFFNALIQTSGHIDVPDRNRTEFDIQRELFQNDDTRAILLEPYLTRNGGGYKKAGLGGKRNVCKESYSKILIDCAKLLNDMDVVITQSDWKQQLNLNKLGSNDFVFLDPPYMDADVRAYGNDFDHAGMVKILKKAKFKWMLTEYAQDIYIKAFGQPQHEFVVQLSCDGRNTEKRTECVWTNY